MSFVVISPDGLPIRSKPFATRVAAKKALKEFVARFAIQGYYAASNEDIELDKLAARCQIVPQKYRRSIGSFE